MVELEMPTEELVGQEIIFTVSIVSSEIYTMLSGKYDDALAIEDPRVKEFYKQMFNSMAMQNEERQYFGMYGKITTADQSKKQEEYALNKILVENNAEGPEPIPEESDSQESVGGSSLDSIGGQMYKKLQKNNPIKGHSKPTKNDVEKLSQIFMV